VTRPAPAAEPLELHLPARAPFDAAGLLAHFAARAVPGVEAVARGEYVRALRLRGGPGVVGLAPEGDGVRCRLWLADPDDAADAARRCAALLDLDRDPATVVAVLGGDELIGPLVRAVPGRRVPGAVDGAELAVRAVLGQQVSVTGAATIAGRLAAACGEPLPAGLARDGVQRLFPASAALAALDAGSLPMPAARARALIGLCAALAAGDVDLRAGADPDAAEEALLGLPGIGPWTAAYVRLRALRDPDAFPAADLGLLRALERLGAGGSPRAAAALAERWRPLRGYAAQHLWGLGA
jgi:AraC family transcriptional regulator of adaptative response / DNA-3-methyladenine glycosylase II